MSKRIASACLTCLLVWPFLSGCIRVADGWAIYQVRGTLIETDSNPSVEGIRIKVELLRQGKPILPDEAHEIAVHDQGSFDTEVIVDRGGGLVIWPVPFLLLGHVPRYGRPPQAARLSITQAGEARIVDVALTASMFHKDEDVRRCIELGCVQVPEARAGRFDHNPAAADTELSAASSDKAP